MHWQDPVLAIATVAFIVALIPTVLSRNEKPALATSVLTAIILFVVTVAYFSLGLLLAGTASCVEGVLWALIMVQSLRIRARDPGSPTV